MRNLATIQTIDKLEEITGADNIVVASILGWKVVVKKNEFFEGDLCVYCEIDSVLPDREEFEFLRDKKFRIKTIRLKGQISQGICFPISILPKGKFYSVGDDVTNILGIVKYEIPDDIGTPKQSSKFIYPKWFPIFLRRWLKTKPRLATFVTKLLPRQVKKQRTWPSYFPKTDETRVQVLGNYLKKFEGIKCYVTEKLDGSSLTMFKLDNKLRVCSRNLELENDGNNWYEAVKKLNIEKEFPEGIVLQGELIGPGIQGNKYKLQEHQIRFFHGYNIKEHKYLTNDEFIQTVRNLNLSTVPYLTTISLTSSIDDLVKLSIGESALNKIPREGIVIRPIDDIYEANCDGKFQGGRVSFKSINPEFLLKFGE